MLAAVLGVDPDAPRGELRLAPPAPSPVGAVHAEGLTFAGRPLAVRIDADGGVLGADTADGVRVTVGRPADDVAARGSRAGSRAGARGGPVPAYGAGTEAGSRPDAVRPSAT